MADRAGGSDHPSDESVLVVHGIANRSPEAFDRDIERMTEALAPRRVIPVFWGDLGPEHDLTCLPDLDAPHVVVGGATHDGLAPDTAGTVEAVDETVRRVAERSGETVPNRTVETIREALTSFGRARGARPQETVVEVLTEAVLAAGPEGHAAIEAAGERRPVRDSPIARRLRAMVDAVDDGVDAFSRSMLSSLVRDRSSGVGSMVARTVGDILTYERQGHVIRGRLDAAYQDARQHGRVHLLGHSLGALIAIEWLLGADVAADDPTGPHERRVSKVVTFGAQVSLFCELHGLLTADGHTGSVAPVPLDALLDRWYNVWHALDPLAFVMAPVLQVRDADGHDLIEDLRLDPEGLGLSLSFHSGYWSDARFLSWLAATL